MEQSSKHLTLFWIDEVNKYAKSLGMAIEPLPEVVLVGSPEQENKTDDLLISTGGYSPSDKTVVLYIDNRHLKDIIRSYCHELIHHMQNLDNGDYMRRVMANASDVIDSNELEELEGEAYLKGNLLLRKFTEQFKQRAKKAGSI